MDAPKSFPIEPLSNPQSTMFFGDAYAAFRAEMGAGEASLPLTVNHRGITVWLARSAVYLSIARSGISRRSLGVTPPESQFKLKHDGGGWRSMSMERHIGRRSLG